MFYRGIKVTPENVAVEKRVLTGGIYRGVKHEPVKSKKSKSRFDGIYRGVKWEG
tara:strand:- start:90 stop:251 length:162 start_codon:yes stop_codon:yes gene_type:complete